MKATVEQQIYLYKLLDARATITENGIEDIVETLTWDNIIEIADYLRNGKE
jgi:hypothetical protein